MERMRGMHSRTVRHGACVLAACVIGVAGFLVFAGSGAEAQPGSSGGVTLVGAGDIADCNSKRDEATARLLGRVGGTVFTLGDNVQYKGARREFTECYAPSWGRYKQRTYPAAGNHEYDTSGARPYYDYFGAKAGSPGRGYYAYDKGSWHVVVLNSNCDDVGCGPRSPQVRWLRQNLARNQSRCTLAYFHHPLFASRKDVRTPEVRAFWNVLYNRDADVILNGHAHSYERFSPQRPDGTEDRRNGIRQFVAGTGGKPALAPFGPRPANSQVRNDKTPGVLKLGLYRDSYRWKFVPVAGRSFTDSGKYACH